MNTTNINLHVDNKSTSTSKTMNAVVVTGYGGPEVFQYTKVARPVPKDSEVLIKIRATAITAAASAMRTGKPYFGRLFLGLTKPKQAIQGTDLAGEIIAIGKDIQKYKVGDKVVAATDIKCGTYAEYICLTEEDIMIVQPPNMTATEATGMMDGAMTALSFFVDTIQLEKGQHILINGASGSIGTAAVQLAKHFGAKVTGVCSGKNVALVKSLGADYVIDYQKEDFTTMGTQYDIVFDTVGKLNIPKSKKSLDARRNFHDARIGDGNFISGIACRSFWKAKGQVLCNGFDRC